MKPGKWPKRLLIAVITTVGIWLLGDFIYSRTIAYRIGRWERGIQRDAEGVRDGCQDFTVGEGGSAILMVHGINDSPATYIKLAPALADRGFTCRVMRLPGFAQPIQQYAGKTHADWIAAVDQELEQLASSHDRVYVVAHSLGAAITIATLAEHRPQVDRLVLLAPAIDVANDRSPLLPTRTWHAIGNALLLFTTVTESPFSIDAHAVTEDEYPWRTPFAPRSIFDETFWLVKENRDRGSLITMPLLMVLAKDDCVIDNDAAESFFQTVAAADKRLIVVENSGHALTIDADWQRVADEIHSFLTESSQNGATQDSAVSD